jgi:hypothetical protein
VHSGALFGQDGCGWTFTVEAVNCDINVDDNKAITGRSISLLFGQKK